MDIEVLTEYFIYRIRYKELEAFKEDFEKNIQKYTQKQSKIDISIIYICAIEAYRALKMIKLNSLNYSNEYRNNVKFSTDSECTMEQDDPQTPMPSKKANPHVEISRLINQEQFFKILQEIDTDNKSGLFGDDAERVDELVYDYYIIDLHIES